MDLTPTEISRRGGQVVPNRAGEDSVRVILHCRADLGEESRDLRRYELENRFQELPALVGEELSLNARTLAISAQTIEALVPVWRFDAIVAALRERDTWVRSFEPMKLA